MTKIFILYDTETGTRLYFHDEATRQDYCTKILTTAVKAGVPVAHLPTFGYDANYNTFLLVDDEVDPSFDETAWKMYFE